MAGISWIKIETTLPNKPVVLRLRRLLKKNQSEIVGLLVRLLCWADGATSDGALPDMIPEDLDLIVNCDGFGVALIEAGWLSEVEGGLKFNEWDLHNGTTAKRRAMKARGMEISRSGKGVDKNVHKVSTEEPQSVHLDKIRLEKNIEGVITPTPRPKKRNEIAYPGAMTIIPDDGHNIDFLEAFGKQPKDPRAFMINWQAALEEVKDGALLVEAAKIAIQRMIEREGDTTFLQAPEYWLGDRKYRDYLSQSKRAVQVTVNKFKVNYEG